MEKYSDDQYSTNVIIQVRIQVSKTAPRKMRMSFNVITFRKTFVELCKKYYFSYTKYK